MPVAGLRARNPSEALRAAGLGGGAGSIAAGSIAAGSIAGSRGVAGKRYGAGEDEVEVKPVLAMAMGMFALARRSGGSGSTCDAARLLRSVLVEHQSVADAARAEGVSVSYAHAMLRDFRTMMGRICETNRWDIAVVLE